MADKTYVPEGEGSFVSSHIGATFEALASTISNRHNAGSDESYTNRLLSGQDVVLVEKISEEAQEVVEAALEGDVDHLRYEVADLVFHIMVLLEREGISLDEFAAELNERMTDEERPEGAIRLYPQFVNRGK